MLEKKVACTISCFYTLLFDQPRVLKVSVMRPLNSHYRLTYVELVLPAFMLMALVGVLLVVLWSLAGSF